MTLRGLVLIIGLGLAACAPGSPGSIAMMGDAEMRQQKTIDLCYAYGVNHSQRVWGEIVRRGMIRPEQQAAIAAKQVRVGMNTCELFASWGAPDHTNRTVVGQHESVQYVYRPCDACDAQYIYTEAGTVTAFQD